MMTTTGRAPERGAGSMVDAKSGNAHDPVRARPYDARSVALLGGSRSARRLEPVPSGGERVVVLSRECKGQEGSIDAHPGERIPSAAHRGSVSKGSRLATIAEVAEHAGVGVGTVSRVLNG